MTNSDPPTAPPRLDDDEAAARKRVAAVPAPWRLSGDAWIFLVSMPKELLPAASFTPEALRGREAGGFSAAMVVNYRASNVGPYQEILWIPGFFRFADRKRLSITRIFVSTWESVENGQRNWGIPKDRADFAITAERDDVEHIVVSKNGQVFADLRVKKTGFSLPVPALPLPKAMGEVGQLLDGREYFYSPSVRGKFAGAKFLGGTFAGAQFPDLTQGRILTGVRITDFVMNFPIAEVRAAVPVPTLAG
jgi:hypothetical protein